MYLNISISFGFNLTAMSFETKEYSFNTLFCVFIGANAVFIPLFTGIILYDKLKSATLKEK